MAVDYNDRNHCTPLLAALAGVWGQFCCGGKIWTSSDYLLRYQIYKANTIEKLNLDELVAAATPSSFGQGTKTVHDPQVRSSLEIPASKLNASSLSSIAREFKIDALCLDRPHELRPYKLVIYQDGGHFDQHRDTVRGEGHIGTLVLILNSAYTGGELEIAHGGRTEGVTGPYHWVAMYGDCLHKINPVTSGTRVSLIYDIYLTSGACHEFKEVWSTPYSYAPLRQSTPRVLNVAKVAAIRTALDAELVAFPSVVICLQHMYPACQAVPGFLKGGDAVLYDALNDHHYDVQVVHCSIDNYVSFGTEDYASDDEDYGTVLSARLFTSFEPSPSDAPTPTTQGFANATTKLVIPTALNPASVLDYDPEIGYTGNECDAKETVYVVAGLQVRRRE